MPNAEAAAAEAYEFPLSQEAVRSLAVPDVLRVALEGIFEEPATSIVAGNIARVISDPEIDLEISAVQTLADGDECAVYIWPGRLRVRVSSSAQDEEERQAFEADLHFSSVRSSTDVEMFAEGLDL